ncbi:bifunctional phosphopantothenoylcysteine decarboxylase/phosphopantothenate--cysteine ligase CoaBC [Methanococcoides alaskense]|uniref:Coenzyme A biosynthesis bifunctional protein CoaBC n=1 Tax=Methanococcoides alaskense TaxID=325778 RepID=A0AA90Z678_9EURY|nr:bifunctional phosphopantothenoylcysteine decarboxylase/phosphopantothenate--cysteine ligase CoaBC [Methanococcoides alaskense]MDA0525267.1 bifunctional phosphopantothenoylcysteine decarboxylase/phosphopantothenate--cysteine ligase CoaBC [Methanococcoides alaskense]MDR6221809.1 phosphopantothenoylcysteine decarboxylase/phosphopantothenate--cysteine ligase [Methanococcoides alaskense]
MNTSRHPTMWIKGQKSASLSGKTIVLAVTGSIGAVRVIELARELIRNGADVYGVMSEAAQHIIHKDALHYATGHEVITDLAGEVEHVKFCGAEGCADLLLIAPATANTIGKMAVGVDDTPVTTFATTAIGSGISVIVVPAMHNSMYEHPAVMENIDKLKSWDISFVGPHLSEGVAKIASNDQIVLAAERVLGDSVLSGKKVLITSGATAESIDPIRIVTNRSSGVTGREIALEFYRRGADVTVVHRGNLEFDGISEILVENAGQMVDATLKELEHDYDMLISAAAISDYTIDARDDKIKSGGDLSLKFRSTRKLIREVRDAYPDISVIGFKAEAYISEDELIARAKDSMKDADLDMVVANEVGTSGMGTIENDVYIIPAENGEITHVSGSKRLIAEALAGNIEDMLTKRELNVH